MLQKWNSKALNDKKGFLFVVDWNEKMFLKVYWKWLINKFTSNNIKTLNIKNREVKKAFFFALKMRFLVTKFFISLNLISAWLPISYRLSNM